MGSIAKYRSQQVPAHQAVPIVQQHLTLAQTMMRAM